MSINQSANKIISALNKKGPELNNFTYGTVVSVSPLSIQLENGLLLNDPDLIQLSALCQEYVRSYKTDWFPSGLKADAGPDPSLIAIPHPDHVFEHNHTIEIEHWRGLRVGDIVYIIVNTDRQLYYVMERKDMVVEGIGWE